MLSKIKNPIKTKNTILLISILRQISNKDKHIVCIKMNRCLTEGDFVFCFNTQKVTICFL